METTIDTATTKRQKLENKSEIEDVDAEDSLEDIIVGFSDDVRAYMEQFNKLAQQANPGVRLHFPTSRSTISQYYVDGDRICFGPSQDIECPYRVTITMSTASLQVDYRTDYPTNLREKILILKSRCSFCSY
jgi:hypothetical protein